MTRTKTTLTLKIISFILSLLIAFYAVPSIIYAEAIDAISGLSSGGEDEAAESGAATAKKSIYEVASLRQESSKTFKLTDGSFVAAQYPSAVHRKDASGVWQDIDNSLAAYGSEYATSDARVKFAKKITGNEVLFTLHENNKKITFSLNGAIKKTKGEIKALSGADSGADELSKLMTLDKLNSAIIYENILDGVDLEYIVASNKIKENIIVKEAAESYVYSFTLKLNNLTAELTASGDIEIKDEGGSITYIIPAPVIYDAKGIHAPASVGSYALTALGNGSYTLTVTADASWMNSPERAFPITVDPAVSTPDSNMIDLYVNSDNPDTSFGGSMSLNVGESSFLYWKPKNMKMLPFNAYIESATLSLYHLSGNGGYLGAYKVTSAWDETLTWNKIFNEGKGAVSQYNISYAKILSTITLNKFVSFDITKAVKEWAADEASNYGIAIKNLSGSTDVNSFLKSFASMENSVYNRPTFVVKYRNINGLEDYYSYLSHNVGAAGAGNINLATGNAVLTIPTLTTTDSIFSYTPTLVYDSGKANSFNVYTNAQVPYEYRMAHLGFKWNMQQSVIYRQYVTSESDVGYFHIWCDADGTEHVFYPTEVENKYVDEDGLLLVLTDNGTSVVIESMDGTKMTFSEANAIASYDISKSWCLTQIEDRVGNKLSFTLESPYNRITEIKVTPCGASTSTILKIYYNSSLFPYLVYNEATYEAVVLRTSNAGGTSTYNEYLYLSEIAYAHGTAATTLDNWYQYHLNEANASNITTDAKTTLEYCSTGQIRKITDSLSGYAIEYIWNNNKILQINEYGQGNTQGQTITLSYHPSHTYTRASGSDDVHGTGDDVCTCYTFDAAGRAVSTYSHDANSSKFYGASSGTYETQENIKNNLKEQIVLGESSANYIVNGSFEEKSGSEFNYWTKTANVKSGTLDGLVHTGACRFDVVPGAIDSITQYVYLPSGEYNLAFDMSSYDANGVSVRVEIQSILNSAYSVNKSFSLTDSAVSIRDREAFTFNVSTNDGVRGDKLRISFVVTGSSSASQNATVCIDNVMLTESKGSYDYSLVTMGGFEPSSINSSGSALQSPNTAWQIDGTKAITHYAYEPYGSCALIYANVKEARYIKQRVYDASDSLHLYIDNQLPSNNEYKYILSGYGCATDAVKSMNSSFRLRADVAYYQKSTGENVIVSHYFDFSPYTSNWQFISGSFSTKDIPESKKVSGAIYDFVSYIEIYCEYSYQSNTYAQFDNISVICCNESNTKEYSYYENGLLKSSYNFLYKEQYYYDANGDVIRHANNRGELYCYEYAENRLPIKETLYHFTNSGHTEYPWDEENPDAYLDKELIRTTSYTYNLCGLCTQSVTSAEGEKNIVNEYMYSVSPRIYGALIREEDSLGKAVRYFYDSNSGRLLATVNEDSGEGVVYTYDASGRLICVKPASYVITSNSYIAVNGAEEVEYTYNAAGMLTDITTEKTEYSFTYDSFGNASSVKAGDNTVVSYSYNQNNGKLAALTYANGLTEEYEYNTLELLETVWYNVGGVRTKAYEYEYTSKGYLSKLKNNLTGEITEYTYNYRGALLYLTKYDSAEAYNSYNEKYIYNEEGRVSGIFGYVYYDCLSIPQSKQVQSSYTYDSQGKITKYRVQTAGTAIRDVEYSYDAYNRITSVTNSATGSYSNTVSYTYNETSANTSAEVETYKSVVSGNIDRYIYVYDGNGNIEAYSRTVNGTTYYITYEYDDLGQLIREDNEELGFTYIYTYDNAGNIISSSKYELTDSSSYPTLLISTETYGYSSSAWGDKLTSYNGHEITYDAIGNPLSYYNGKNYTFTWRGRQMTSLTKDGVTYYFEYDDAGHKIREIKNGLTTNYYYSGDRLILEKCGEFFVAYLYDDKGSPIGFQYHEPSFGAEGYYTFWFEKNLQGDVVALYDDSGTKLLSYTYDAWGNASVTYHTSTETFQMVCAMGNPIRYRGYYYDSDLELYCLGTRYYDSVTGRFVSPDSVDYLGANGDLNSYNLYAYCSNNPVNRVDPTGQFWKELWDAFTKTIQQASGYFAVAAGVSQVDTLAPGPADVVSGGLLLGGVLVCAGVAIYTAITAPAPSISIPKSEEKAEAIPTTPPSSTVIYRYGGTNPGNLTPKAKDKYSGLSFSTVPMPGAAVTTIEALNATGVVYAVQDGPTHVSVRPVGATMEDWINAGSGSIWTQAVKSVLIKRDGDY